MLLLSRKDIKKVFTMKDAIETNKECFKLFSEGKSEVPLRTTIQAPNHNGVFLFMPSYVEELDAAGLKVVNIFPENVKENLPTAPAQVLLIDGKTGIVTAILDGTYVTQLRTGASSGAAFDLFAIKNAKIGALIGTGGQAATQLEAMMVARELDEVRIFDLDGKRRQAFVSEMQKELKCYNTKIVEATSSDNAIENADIIVTVTPSTKPVFDGTKVKKGATVSCVGAYQHHMQEMDPAILPRASKIYFDSEEAVLSEAGDILIPLEQGIITKDDFTGDIGDVLLGKVVGRENDEEIIVYENVGIGVLDLMTARAIYLKAVEAEVGTNWE
ncbi:MAG: ornithine cyclodeaminase family protein [Terrisporobacter othiniensis]|uniref:ornithine cyclodeaminase family protein n=1 Tax=Terrisporobacter petrolearius TaxID=1460447 RepID=UPI0008E59182|nr:ornithine cyclodeaminase family protein [Terrisporobacter petrolearius]MDU4862452.1 ornithine cyclodeaminase family protein [Terrisporobacter othiniensis]MDU6993656.1 ornithine cyclodeaminase family protein [Terrisporobacter othiniensis]SFJ15873.1 ornithine cyclodeaminase [Terrisporobacter glycolicus]